MFTRAGILKRGTGTGGKSKIPTPELKIIALGRASALELLDIIFPTKFWALCWTSANCSWQTERNIQKLKRVEEPNFGLRKDSG